MHSHADDGLKELCYGKGICEKVSSLFSTVLPSSSFAFVLYLRVTGEPVPKLTRSVSYRAVWLGFIPHTSCTSRIVSGMCPVYTFLPLASSYEQTPISCGPSVVFLKNVYVFGCGPSRTRNSVPTFCARSLVSPGNSFDTLLAISLGSVFRSSAVGCLSAIGRVIANSF